MREPLYMTLNLSEDGPDTPSSNSCPMTMFIPLA